MTARLLAGSSLHHKSIRHLPLGKPCHIALADDAVGLAPTDFEDSTLPPGLQDE